MYNRHKKYYYIQEGSEVMEKQEAQKEREARNAYHRAWTRRNPDKVKAAQKRFYARIAEKLKGSEKNEG